MSIGGKMKDRIESIIRLHDLENPIYSIEIETQTGLSGILVREILRELRREHKPIANSNKGYFWAKNMAELQDTLDDLEHRETSLRITRKAMENCFSEQELTLNF